jgi:hypothetical protein
MKRLTLLLASACLAGSCVLPFDKPSLPDAFVERARIEFDGRAFKFFHVASFGLLRDRQYLQAHHNGVLNDPLPGQLAEVLRASRTEPVLLAVGGAYSEKCQVVIEAALALIGDMPLPGLELIFLGDRRHGRALEGPLRARGVNYRCVPVGD